MQLANHLLLQQRSFFQSGKTRSLEFRLEQLRKLERMIRTNEEKILAALHQDLRKPKAEAWASEIALVLEEIAVMTKNLKAWSKSSRLPIPLALQPASARIYPDPYGQVLIMAPWNYPFQLLLSPAVGAIAAGNVVTLKPSEFAMNTSQLIGELFQDTFAPEYLMVIEGGVEVNRQLLAHRFDYIFFTGSPQVGRLVMSAAAPHLTPVTLELGGKSPCIVDRSVDLKTAGRRIAWGKFYNTGQTCVAPDYLLVHKSVRQELLHSLVDAIESFYGKDPKTSPDYGRIINHRHFDRLINYLKDGEVLYGGQFDSHQLYISPTLIVQPVRDSALMTEEIFGPLLPVLEYEHLREALEVIERAPHPLALYLFSNDKKIQDTVMSSVAFGGGCLNDCVVQLGASSIPFGGVGASGMGRYHGKTSFDTFTHYKPILKRATWSDPQFRYPPYKDHLKYFKFFLD